MVIARVTSHEENKSTYCYLNISQKITCITKAVNNKNSERPNNEKEDIDNRRSGNFVLTVLRTLADLQETMSGDSTQSHSITILKELAYKYIELLN
ncbi:LOW QUALITY PROTEIN: hypothetical protein TorRG33x02_261040 [Trema orientale]|uniref:Uncharacterized protein n=1 Tax=Trema orientale TaxID=63057 RepID=A0A2P5D690_TREOI|nr:LOW QUALITY PROTEIN: hypothetical protein TorRG33x02_261040 [Trema orientale]